tara:strand:- start:4467 stop:4811 length:345 start_codon:yes stop_codon:yes gene_type:complete
MEFKEIEPADTTASPVSANETRLAISATGAQIKSARTLHSSVLPKKKCALELYAMASNSPERNGRHYEIKRQAALCGILLTWPKAARYLQLAQNGISKVLTAGPFFNPKRWSYV